MPVPTPKISFVYFQLKASHADLSLPPEQLHQSTNQNSAYKRHSHAPKSLPFKPLSSVHELVESHGNKNRFSENRVRDENLNVNGNSSYNSHSFPGKTEATVQRQKSRSNLDLRQTDSEVNNNKMGGVLSQSNGQTKNRHQKSGKQVAESDIRNNNRMESQEAYKQARVHRQSSDRSLDNGGFVDNHPDLIQQVKNMPLKKSNDNNRQMANDMKAHMKHARTKHDSGFASEPPLSSDEMYDSGFKQELTTQNGNHLTSSPKSVRKSSDKRQQPHNVIGYPVQNRQGFLNGYNPQQNQHVRSLDSFPGQYGPVENTIMSHNGQYSLDGYQNYNSVNNANLVNGKSDKHVLHSSKSDVRPSGQGHRPRSSESPRQIGAGPDTRQRKSLGDANLRRKHSFENEQPVVKTKSLGDLSQGCTFSLVGQKKMGKSPPQVQHPTNVTEFSGSQMMKHIRKYKEMSQKDKPSVPMKGHALDDMDTFIGKCSPESQASEPTSQVKHNVKPVHYGSLQHLPMSVADSQYQGEPGQTGRGGALQKREQTPLKPRRCLPQTPGDVQEKKKQISDLVKTRMSISSRCSAESPGSSNSNRPGSVDARIRGVSATPSDREVCNLLDENRSNSMWRPQGPPQAMCNTNHHMAQGDSVQGSQDSCYGSANVSSNNLRKSGSFGSHDHHAMGPSGGRLSESGQTTLTSQSTIDSGYVTTDLDNEILSTSSYAKSLQQSAQNLFKRHSQKAENSVQLQYQNMPNSDTTSKGSHSYAPQVKDSHAHTKHWLENHPGTFMNEHNYKMSLNLAQSEQNGSNPHYDRNNNKSGKVPNKYTSELDLTQSQRQNRNQGHTLNANSGQTARDIERTKSDSGQLRSKGKSVSMSHGLNLIANQPNHTNGPTLTVCQPKFTGSLKDLIGVDKEIVPIETFRLESATSTGTLPGNWKFQGQSRSESSLKLFGKPSLFQLLQNYNLYAVRVKLPEDFVVTDNLRMIECEVLLPSPWIHGKDNSMATSPKGSVPKLGGPNSAFKPVAAGSTSSVKSVSMVTILDFSATLLELLEPGQLQKGDLIVEVIV